MGLNRPHTDEEKNNLGAKSAAWWSSDAGQAAKKRRGAFFAKWNKTRVHSPEARAKFSKNLTRVNKTRHRSVEERAASSARMAKKLKDGWRRKPFTEYERNFHRERMIGNTLGVGHKMPDDLKERHRQRMLTNNPGIGAHKLPNLRRAGPNKAEARMDKLISHLGFRFVGDSKFWIGPGPSGLMRNPDWIWRDGKTKKIAVLHHGDYWHRLRQEDDAVALKDYEALGWSLLVIWERENKRTKTNPALTQKVETWLKQILESSND